MAEKVQKVTHMTHKWQVAMVVLLGVVLLPSFAGAIELFHWNFDSDFTDSVSGNNVTIGSGTPAETIITTDGIIGNGSVSLPGGPPNNRGLTGNSTAVVPETRSVSAWFKSSTTVVGDFNTIFAWDLDDTTKAWYLSLKPSTGELRVGQGAASANLRLWTSSTTVTLDEWHHAVMVQTRNETPFLYIDGVLTSVAITTNIGTLHDVTGETLKLRVGQGGTFAAFNGSIDDVRVYDGALDASEVLALYNLRPVGDVVLYTLFDGTTTNFSAENTLSVDNPIIEKVGNFKIAWTGTSLNFSGADFDTYVIETPTSVFVDSVNLPIGINTEANVTIRNQTGLIDPIVFIDGVKCLTCAMSYDGENVSAVVPGFSNITFGNNTNNVTVFVANLQNVSQSNFCVDYVGVRTFDNGTASGGQCTVGSTIVFEEVHEGIYNFSLTNLTGFFNVTKTEVNITNETAVTIETKEFPVVSNVQVFGANELFEDTSNISGFITTGNINSGFKTQVAGFRFTPDYDQYLIDIWTAACGADSETLTVRHQNGTIMASWRYVEKDGTKSHYKDVKGVLLEAGVNYLFQADSDVGSSKVCEQPNAGIGGRAYPVAISSGQITDHYPNPSTASPNENVYNFTVQTRSASPVWNKTSEKVVVLWDDGAIDRNATITHNAGSTVVYNVSAVSFTTNDFIVGESTVSILLEEAFGDGVATSSGGDAVNVSKLTAPANVLPSGGSITNPIFNSTWSAATSGIGAIVYDALLEVAGTNYSQVTNTTATFVEINQSQEGTAYVYVRSSDDFFTDEYVQSVSSFEILFVPEISADVCAGLTFPNEDDLPTVASIPVNFTATYVLGFTAPVVNVSVRQGTDVFYNDVCTETIDSATQRSYNCTVPMRYFYAPADYDLNITVTDGVKSATAVTSGACTYGQLVASKRTTLAVGFPNAGPGIVDSPGDTPVNVRNTGNVELNLFMKAYDLDGRSSPGNQLSASTFKVGQSLGTSVQMQHGVEKNLSMSVVPGDGASADMSMWLSMPPTQLLQDYFANTPWQVVTTG